MHRIDQCEQWISQPCSIVATTFFRDWMCRLWLLLKSSMDFGGGIDATNNVN